MNTVLVWKKFDGEYWSEGDRFSIAKATDHIHGGDWVLTDWKSNQKYWKPTLKDCKYIAQTIIEH